MPCQRGVETFEKNSPLREIEGVFKREILRYHRGLATSAKKLMGTMKKIALLMILLMTVFSGCSVLVNSEKFYGDRPQRPINWREYTTD
jgi:hypothetical protein